MHLYRVRLRARPLQECFAIVGIAAGVALLFASQVASSEPVELCGTALARDRRQRHAAADRTRPPWLRSRLLGAGAPRSRACASAAPLLEATANAIGPEAQRPSSSSAPTRASRELGGSLLRHTALSPFAGIDAVVLPAPLAQQDRRDQVRPGSDLPGARARRRSRALRSSCTTADRSAVDTRSRITHAQYAQEIDRSLRTCQPDPRRAGPRPGSRGARGPAAAGRWTDSTSSPPSYDEKLFDRAAAAPTSPPPLFARDQRARRVPVRVQRDAPDSAPAQAADRRSAPRRIPARERDRGAAVRRDRARLLACVLGLALGEELSIHLFRSNPGYLSSAFAVGSQRIVSAQSVASRSAAGMLAALRRGAQPAARHPLARPAAGDAPGRSTGGDGGAGLGSSRSRARAPGRGERDPARRPEGGDRRHGLPGGSAAVAAAAASGRDARAGTPHGAGDYERRPARGGDGAARGPHTRAGDLRHGRDRRVRQRRDPDGARGSSARAGKRRARHERVHRCMGLAGRLVQPAA